MLWCIFVEAAFKVWLQRRNWKAWKIRRKRAVFSTPAIWDIKSRPYLWRRTASRHFCSKFCDFKQYFSWRNIANETFLEFKKIFSRDLEEFLSLFVKPIINHCYISLFWAFNPKEVELILPRQRIFSGLFCFFVSASFVRTTKTLEQECMWWGKNAMKDWDCNLKKGKRNKSKKWHVDMNCKKEKKKRLFS